MGRDRRRRTRRRESRPACAAATSSAVIVLPGRLTNSPPAASTNSATHGCEAMIGFPHSSQNTLGLDALRGAFADRLDVKLHGGDHVLPALPCAHHSCDRSDVGVDVGQRSRSQPKKSHARFQNFGHRLQLVGNRSQHQVGTRGQNLFRLCASRSRRRSRASRRQLRDKRRHNIWCRRPAGPAAQIAQRDRCAGLERNHPLRSVIGVQGCSIIRRAERQGVVRVAQQSGESDLHSGEYRD